MTGEEHTKEALKLALEFIERVNKDGWILADFEPQMYATITAIKKALAQPEPYTEWLACPKCEHKSPYSPIKAKTLAEDAERITKQARAQIAEMMIKEKNI